MRKFMQKIHLWLAVPFGLIIFLTCFSGAMLVFEPEIHKLSNHNIYYVSEVKEQAIPLETLMKGVAATLPDSVQVTGVTISDNPELAYQVSLSKPKRASLFVDQYTGKVTGMYERGAFFKNMFFLHRWLLDGGNPKEGGVFHGKLIVGISTLMFVIVLITGIVIWAYRARKSFKRSLKIMLGNGKVLFYKSLHVAGGMYVVVFLLAIALTGLTWSFDWYRTGFYKVFGVEQTEQQHGERGGRGDKGGRGEHGGKGERAEHGHGEYHGERGHGERGEHHGHGHGADANTGASQQVYADVWTSFTNWQSVYDTVKAQNPGAPSITISEGSAQVSLGNYGNNRAADTYTFDKNSGKITGEQKYADTEKADKMRGWIYAVHTGVWGGIIGRIIAFIAALFGATLPLTGYYIWIKRLRNKRKPQ
jgi:uncharacterized iron-regulated membrane protein